MKAIKIKRKEMAGKDARSRDCERATVMQWLCENDACVCVLLLLVVVVSRTVSDAVLVWQCKTDVDSVCEKWGVDRVVKDGGERH